MSKLTQSSSFNTRLLSVLSDRNIIQDRLPGDILTLPYNDEGIKLSVNDFVISDNINYSLDNLYNNWLYLISNSIIPSNNIPNGKLYTSMIADIKGNDGVRWIDKNTFPSVSGTTPSGELNGVKKLTKVNNIANSSNFNIIATTNTNVILLSGSDDTAVDIISTSDITHPSNNIKFEGIQDQTINSSGELFIADSTLHILVKFDISGILTLDKSILNNDTPGRLMTELIGGPGDINDKTKFHNIVSITSVNDMIYVLDHEVGIGTTIKQFDSQLNWRASHKLNIQLPATPICLKHNTSTNRFYILCHDTQLIPTITTFDINWNYIETNDLMESSRHAASIKSEVFKNFHFSIENPNIMYIVTSENIYKKYLSRPSRFIGRFLLTEKSIGTGDGNTMDFMDLSIDTVYVDDAGERLMKDEMFIFESNFEIIHRFIEDSNYEQSLETSFDDKVLYQEDLLIKSEESVNSIVYNKTLIKHIYNNTLLLENTSRKFSTTFDEAGISRYIGFKYLNINELKSLNYKTTLDNFVGINEPVTTHTVNRCLEQVLILQNQIMNNMQEKSTNVYPLIDRPVLLEY